MRSILPSSKNSPTTADNFRIQKKECDTFHSVTILFETDHKNIPSWLLHFYPSHSLFIETLCGDVVSLLVQEFKPPLQDTEDYGLFFMLDMKTYFWLEDTETLLSYDLYAKKVLHFVTSFTCLIRCIKGNNNIRSETHSNGSVIHGNEEEDSSGYGHTRCKVFSNGSETVQNSTRQTR